MFAVSDPTDISRKLVAVFAADVEGYSRLMSTDEVGTLKGLTERRATLIACRAVENEVKDDLLKFGPDHRRSDRARRRPSSKRREAKCTRVVTMVSCSSWLA